MVKRIRTQAAALVAAFVLLSSPLFAAVQFSTAVRNGRLDSVESVIGTSAVLKLRTGAQPANCAAADSGTVVATLNLPSDWMAAASAGAKAKLGTWQDTAADNSGTIAHFRVYASDGTTCGMQGSVGLTSSGADLELDAVVVTGGQAITLSAFNLTDGNP